MKEGCNIADVANEEGVEKMRAPCDIIRATVGMNKHTDACRRGQFASCECSITCAIPNCHRFVCLYFSLLI